MSLVYILCLKYTYVCIFIAAYRYVLDNVKIVKIDKCLSVGSSKLLAFVAQSERVTSGPNMEGQNPKETFFY